MLSKNSINWKGGFPRLGRIYYIFKVLQIKKYNFFLYRYNMVHKKYEKIH